MGFTLQREGNEKLRMRGGENMNILLNKAGQVITRTQQSGLHAWSTKKNVIYKTNNSPTYTLISSHLGMNEMYG